MAAIAPVLKPADRAVISAVHAAAIPEIWIAFPARIDNRQNILRLAAKPSSFMTKVNSRSREYRIKSAFSLGLRPDELWKWYPVVQSRHLEEILCAKFCPINRKPNMDLKHFGDSYDIVKKSLLEWLSAFGPWVAHPMFTHPTNAEEAEAFSRFLGIPLVSTDVLNSSCDRASYFAACKQCHSLFLDPDTGIRIDAVEASRSPSYVFAKELVDLASARPQALTLTFDQSLSRGQDRELISTKLAHFAAQGVHGFAYVSHASFVVLGRSATQIHEAQAQLLARSALPRGRIVAAGGG